MDGALPKKSCVVTQHQQRRHDNILYIFVEMLTNTTVCLKVDGTDTIACVKNMLHAKQGIPPNEQRLLYAGKQLEHGTLFDCGIRSESTLQLVLRLLGGVGTAPILYFFTYDHVNRPTTRLCLAKNFPRGRPRACNFLSHWPNGAGERQWSKWHGW